MKTGFVVEIGMYDFNAFGSESLGFEGPRVARESAEGVGVLDRLRKWWITNPAFQT